MSSLALNRPVLWLAASWWLATATWSEGRESAAGSTQAAKPPQAVEPGSDLFGGTNIPRLRLQISPAGWARLEKDRRQYVEAILSEGAGSYGPVGVHLKGARGSVRPLADKPSFTIDLARFNAEQRFHGLRKIHLNNSVEDPTYLCEKLGSEFFRRARLPAPRVAHACLELNGRPLGLFVLKEGFTGDLLGLYFQQTTGNLYEPDPGQDVGDPMKRRWGRESNALAGLGELASAVRETNLVRRWDRLRVSLDPPAFAAFMSLEVIVGHRDGYTLARNNFRVYHDLDHDRMVFLPQGMDQLFGRPTALWQPSMAGAVARAWMETPEGRGLYRARFSALFTNLFDPATWTNWLGRQAALIRPMLNRSEARSFDLEVGQLQQRVVLRHASLAAQLAEPEPKPVAFVNGRAPLSGWRQLDEPEGGLMDQVKTTDGRRALHIRAGPRTGAAWRCEVLVPPGRYRFEGLVRTAGVEALPFGKAQGANLRVVGRAASGGGVLGDSPWTTRSVPFEAVQSPERVELACELRARAGEAWFDLESLCLRQQP